MTAGQDNNSGNAPPILLAHVACSGGSLIFRELCKRFGLWGISEVSPFASPPRRPFYPYDPESLLFLNNHLSQDDFNDIFLKRLEHCWHACSRATRRLLIREHTHSLFFQPQGIQLNDGFSWIHQQSQQTFGVACPILFSVRDPVDSWLGLNHSFPHLVQYSFDEYCNRYHEMLDQLDSLREQEQVDFLQFKYESFVNAPDPVIESIGQFLEMKLAPATVGPDIRATGNSGRQSAQIRRRPRRSFSRSFLDQALASEAYSRLAKRLDYPHFGDQINWGTRIGATINSIRKAGFRAVYHLARSGIQVIKQRRVAN